VVILCLLFVLGWILLRAAQWSSSAIEIEQFLK